MPDSTIEMDINKLNEITTGQFRLSSDKIDDLELFFGEITQYRFYYRKEWHGRTMHFSNKINTAGGLLYRAAMRNATIDWLQNDACPDIFTFYSDHTALMDCPYESHHSGMNPYTNQVNRLYNHNIFNTAGVNGGTYVLLLIDDRFECDDWINTAGYKSAGVWLYFVR